jgi:hypothetical protein
MPRIDGYIQSGVLDAKSGEDMRWSDVTAITTRAPLPDGYRYEALARAEIPAVVQALRDWYQNIAVGNASGHHDERFAEKVARERPCVSS